MASLPFPPQPPAGWSAAQDTHRFATALFGRKPAGSTLALWQLSTKRSIYFAEAAAVAGWVRRLEDPSNIYLSTGFAPAGLDLHHRPKAHEIAGIPAVWLDLDVLDAGYPEPCRHKKPNLPPTLGDALELLEGLPEPSLIVMTGGGLQCWWLLDSPWLFGGDADRAEAAALVERWQQHVRDRARPHGWDVDSTHDLARLMRLPGTVNPNHGEPRPVWIPRWTAQSYSVAALLASIGTAPSPRPAAIAAPAAPRPTAGVGLILNLNARPPVERLDELYDLFPDAANALRHKLIRQQDRSSSGWDQTIANYAARAGWTDQQIADLIIFHRETVGAERDKTLRLDYHRTTIEKARQLANAYLGEQEIENLPALPPDASLAQRLERLSFFLKSPVTGMTLLLGDEPTFQLDVAGKTLTLPEEDVYNQSRLRRRFWRRRLPPFGRYKPAIWEDEVLPLMQSIWEERGEEFDPVRHWRAALREYCSHVPPHDCRDDDEIYTWRHAALEYRPWRDRDTLHFMLNGTTGLLSRHKQLTGENVGVREVAPYLTAIGWRMRARTIRLPGDDNKPFSRQVWSGPIALLNDADDPEPAEAADDD